MRVTILTCLLLLTWSSTAIAVDCTSWRRLDSDAKRTDVEAIISKHLKSNVSKRYPSENVVSMRHCLTEFTGQIVEEFDHVCGERPGGNANLLDDVFDRYLLTCVK